MTESKNTVRMGGEKRRDREVGYRPVRRKWEQEGIKKSTEENGIEIREQ